MKYDLIIPLLLSVSFLALFGLTEYWYRVRKIKAEVTRKIVHIGTGILTLLFPIFLHSLWQVLFLCGSFFLLLVASLKYHWLPSINAVRRVSYGSLLYPVSVFGCYLFYSSSDKGLIIFYLPILTLALCDPLAAWVGKRFPAGEYRSWKSHKTASGSLAFLLAAFLLAWGAIFVHSADVVSFGKILLFSLSVALAATLAEAVSGAGFDNLTIPASVLLILSLVL